MHNAMPTGAQYVINRLGDALAQSEVTMTEQQARIAALEEERAALLDMLAKVGDT